jgi:hypothetical protein
MADSTTYADIFQHLYTDKDVIDAMISDKQCPWTGMVSKDTSLAGIDIAEPIEIATNQASGPDYATAYAHDGSSAFKQWVGTTQEWYGVATWTLKSLLQSRKRPGSFKKVITSEFDGTQKTFRHDLEIMAFGPPGGYRGVIKAGSDKTSATISLVDRWDALKFPYGMRVQVDDNDGTGGATDRAMTGTPYIIASDAVAGTITLSAHWDDSFAGIADGDYLFKRGSRALEFKGHQHWLPSTLSATSFYGVDRTAAPVFLGGNVYTATTSSIKEGILNALGEAAPYGAAPEVGFIHPSTLMQLMLELEAESIRPRDAQGASKGGTATFGFKGVEIQGPLGSIQLYPCPYVKTTDIFLDDMSTWKILSMGEAPKFLDEDGLKFIRKAGTTNFTASIYMWGAFMNSLPGKSVRVILPS